MKVEIIFISSHTPLEVDAKLLYQKGQALCVHLPSGVIRAFPLCNVFSWSYTHHDHLGSTQPPSG